MRDALRKSRPSSASGVPRMKKLVIIGLSLLACVPVALAGRQGPQPDSWILRDITGYRNQTWHYQRTMGMRPTHYAHSAAQKVPRRYRLWVRTLWRSRASSARKRFLAGPPHRTQWLCIHRYEGAWSDRRRTATTAACRWTSGSMRATAGSLLAHKGTADHWTPLEQMWVAEQAHRSGRGFIPWPNTARYCGLSSAPPACPRILERRQAPSFSRSSSLTTRGSALPFVSFITWPTKKPSRPCLAAAVRLDLSRVGGEHLVDDRLELATCRRPPSARGTDRR